MDDNKHTLHCYKMIILLQRIVSCFHKSYFREKYNIVILNSKLNNAQISDTQNGHNGQQITIITSRNLNFCDAPIGSISKR